jgi:hypothetical protein
VLRRAGGPAIELLVLGLGVALVLGVGACGVAEPTFEPADLERLLPGAAEAPAGTAYRPDRSGPVELGELVAGDTALERELRALGFRAARAVTFTSAEPDLANPRPGTLVYAAFALALGDRERAERGFAFYAERLERRSRGYTPLVGPRLGSEATAFRFSGLGETPLPGAAFLFRVGNALFGVVGAGNPDPDPAAVRRLAEGIDRRARRAG